MKDRPPVDDWSRDFDIFHQDYADDPAPIWKDLQSRCPIAHSERYGSMWMSTRYEDARALAVQTDVLSNRQVSLAPMKSSVDLLADYHSHITPPISNDPPVHTPLRRLILPFFSPRAVALHRDFTESLCHELIDVFCARGTCDAAVEYAQQLTPRVIGNMLDIDPNRSDEFVSWVRGFIELGASDIELRERSRKEMMRFFGDLVRARRGGDGEDYISELLRKDVDGEPIADQMAVNFCLLLLIAGIDTTWSSLGTSLWHFATHPEHRVRMVEEPEIFPTAIEELLRFYAPVSVGRVAMEDVEYGGVTMRRGDRVMINYPAANRDPEAFENPDEVVLDRQQNRHFAFGVGVHRCAGSNLARMEMEVALKVWFERIPEFELADPDGVTWAGGQVRGARNVPVRFPIR
ncbi:MAG: cytochrome P450 [Pseudomonadota bacterium]